MEGPFFPYDTQEQAEDAALERRLAEQEEYDPAAHIEPAAYDCAVAAVKVLDWYRGHAVVIPEHLAGLLAHAERFEAHLVASGGHLAPEGPRGAPEGP